MAKQRVKRQPPKKSRVQKQPNRSLDANALAYAKLLADPCDAPLTNPVYAGGDTGYVTRYELDFTLDSIYSNAQSFGAILFTPGIIGASAADTSTLSGNNSFMALGVTAEGANGMTDTGTRTWTCRSATDTQPGRSALAFLSSSVRTVAACLQVYYVGTELNRKGTLSLGKVNAGSILSNDIASPSGVRQVSQEIFRTPDSCVEHRWTPSDGDQLFTDPSLISLQRESERKSGILFSFAGVPREDIRLRMVVIYEWQPAPGQGVVNPGNNRNRSNFTLDNVLNYLDSTGPWVMKGARIAMKMAYNYTAGSRLTYG